MNHVIAMLFIFVVLGLASRRLGKLAYMVMALTIVAYVTYAYSTG